MPIECHRVYVCAEFGVDSSTQCNTQTHAQTHKHTDTHKLSANSFAPVTRSKTNLLPPTVNCQPPKIHKEQYSTNPYSVSGHKKTLIVPESAYITDTERNHNSEQANRRLNSIRFGRSNSSSSSVKERALTHRNKYKKQQFIHDVNGEGSKQQKKIIKRLYYPPSHRVM